MANAFKRKLSRSVGVTLTAVGAYTVPAATQVTVIGLVVSNTSAASVLVDVTVYDGANDTYLVKSCPIPAGGSVIVVGGDQKLVLEVGDSVRIKSDTATSIDAVMSILELT